MKAAGRFEFEDGKRCFRPFVPEPPPLEALIDMLGPATKALAEFDAALTRLPIQGAVGKLFARLDAVHSSGAEGSTTTFTDLLEYQSALGTSEDEADAATVAACADAFGALDDAFDPVDAVLTIHARLFAGSPDRMAASLAGKLKTRVNNVRDADEATGFFSHTSTASLAEALDEWRALTLGTDPMVDPLIRQGMSHWMYEHIHPVPDGNGRIGRLLLPLMLRRAGETRNACAFIGEAVHEDKETYVEALKQSRKAGSQIPWLRVFLSLVARNARDNLVRLDRLAEIQEEWSRLTLGFRSNSVIHRLVPWMLTTPAFAVKDAAAAMGVTYQGMNEALDKLVSEGILEMADDSRRDRLFQAGEVLSLFDRFRVGASPPPP